MTWLAGSTIIFSAVEEISGVGATEGSEGRLRVPTSEALRVTGGSMLNPNSKHLSFDGCWV